MNVGTERKALLKPTNGFRSKGLTSWLNTNMLHTRHTLLSSSSSLIKGLRESTGLSGLRMHQNILLYFLFTAGSIYTPGKV